LNDPADPLQARSERVVLGMAAAMGAFFMFTVMNLFAKLLSENHSVIEIAFYRNLIASVPFLVAAFAFGRREILVLRSKPVLVGVRAAIGTLSLITTLPLNRRRKRLGLPPVGAAGFTSPRLNLAPVSPSVFPPNPYWAPQHQLTGYWFAEAPQEWQPSASLISFLERGAPPLLITLGAMSLGNEDALENVQLFTGAIQQAGIRAIIQGWDAGMKQLKLPDTVFASGALPHSWLLPRCAGIVHHGGFGTTSAGLRAGVPHLVLPSIADQFYWGQRVHQLGVGLPFIPRPRLDADRLTAALSELHRHTAMHTAASALGEQIRSENGLDVALRLIAETFT